jgi:hypothetical protein
MDRDENHEARFVRWVMDEKKRRQQEERKLQEQWGILVQEKNNLEEQKRNFEAKVAEVKDLIPSAKELLSRCVSQRESLWDRTEGKDPCILSILVELQYIFICVPQLSI